MKYNLFGNAGLFVLRICFGAMTFENITGKRNAGDFEKKFKKEGKAMKSAMYKSKSPCTLDRVLCLKCTFGLSNVHLSSRG